MLKRIMDQISREMSGAIAKHHVEQICRYHRIQASPGFRQAAQWCQQTLQEYGLPAKILEYPADPKTTYWTQAMFKEWSIDEAELRIVEPKESANILARFNENKYSVAQRSHPTPAEGVEAELVVLENGEDPKEYERTKVGDRIVLTSGDVERVRSLAVDKHGALGIVTDRMAEFPPIRQRTDLPDALQYTSFWWQKGQKPCFGFVLSPRQGSELRKLVRGQKGKRPVRLRAKVKSQFYKGKMENVTATIPGATDNEILVVAHLCHPQPSANDNASGCGALIEAARTLQKLVTERQLPQPRRTIRFLLVPEMAGTYAYLATNKHLIPKTLAAINLDMVGENQELCKSPLLIESPPQAASSYVADLLEAILERISTDAKSLAATSSYGLFKQAMVPFSGGSDHYILSDPTVGIPCPMLIQWPDKFYHTSEDTIDKVDPLMLRRVAVLTATYAYFLANAGFPEAVWLMNESMARFKRTLALSVQRKVSEFMDKLRTMEKKIDRMRLAEEFLIHVADYANYRASRQIESIKAISALVEERRHRRDFNFILESKEAEIKNAAELENRNVLEALQYLYPEGKEPSLTSLARQRPSRLQRSAMHLVPRRKVPGPINARFLMSRLNEGDREALRTMVRRITEREMGVLPTLALYWTDGKRTLKEIADLVYLESGKKGLNELSSMFNLLEKARLIKMRRL